MSTSFETDKIIEKILKRISKTAKRLNGSLPGATNIDCKYKLSHGGQWTDSFWVGMLYLAYSYSKDKEFLKYADAFQNFYRLRVQNTDEICEKYDFMPLDHDTGFVFSLSQVARYKLTGEVEARELALSAAELLASRFNEKGNFIRAWDTWKWDEDEEFIKEKKGKVIIDSMMNVPLLLWAYNQVGDSRYYEIAIKHTETVAQYMVREDGSSFHTFNFNHETGEAVQGKTGQGYADDSCWSRGQGWGIYGFALMYSYTADERWKKMCLKLCDYFLSQLTPSYIPVWDFAVLHQKETNFRPWDSSAAAIAASGILEICRHLEEEEKKQFYLEKARRIIQNLTVLCSTIEIDGIEPLLLHGASGPVYNKGTENIVKQNVDIPLIFGDYFYFEALIKLKSRDFELFWYR